MRATSGELDLAVFDERLRHATAQVCLAERVELADLEVHLHPFDVDDIDVADPNRWPVLSNPAVVGGDVRWRGIKVVPDARVRQGAPELRRSWRIPL